MKKIVLTILGIAIAAATVFASNNDGNKVTVVVKNVESTNGIVSVTLFNSSANWLEEGIEQSATIENTGSVIITFENVADGTYAVSVIHDENENGDLDSGVFGIPTEPYGFSNDARGKFGPASFDDSKFEITADKEIEINIK
jgi:uncharacterized protein (DUF2141 family)